MSERALARAILACAGTAALVLVGWLVLGSLEAGGEAPPAGGQLPRGVFQRVFVIVLENANYDAALQEPYLRHLAASGALLSNFHAVTHPSLPNYLAMAGGSTFGVRGDAQTTLEATSLVDRLEAAGVSWKVYAEGLPSPCFLGPSAGPYVRRHEPFISFRNIQADPARCDRIVNADRLQADLARDALPRYSLYVPNVRHDGHDTGVAQADAWLHTFLPPLLENPRFTQGTLVVVTFDESRDALGNRVYTALVGPMIAPGVTDGTWYDHYSLLRTIEDSFGLGTLGRADSRASAICCVWREPRPAGVRSTRPLSTRGGPP